MEREGHPVLSGLLALVGVGLIVGLVVGLAALVGTRMLGFNGETATAEATSNQSMFLPRPEKTEAASGPLITLDADPSASADDEESQPSETESTKKKKKDKQISLSASQTEVSSMEQIDLTGVYPGGEGAILRVEIFSGGGWQEFAQITTNVSDQTFSTYIQSGQVGMQRFRVVDTDTGEASNEVRVRIG